MPDVFIIQWENTHTTRRIKIARFSNGVFSVFSNDKNKNYDTIWSACEFARNREQPEVCSLIRLEVTLILSKDDKRWVAKRVWKRFIQSPSRMNGNAHADLPLLKSTRNGKESNSITYLWNQQKNGPKFMIMLIFLHFFYLYSHFQPFWASWGPIGGPLGALALLWGTLGPSWVA